MKPDFYPSRLNRAKALVAIGQNQSAAEDYQYLLRRDPTNQELIHSLDALAVSVVQKPDAQVADQTSIKMEKEGGVYVVPVRFNDMITLSAIIDSGASDMSVPADVVFTLIRTKSITDQDFLGQQTYVLADGSRVPSQQFRIRSLKVGGKTVENVVASIASVKGEIDNEQHTLVLR